VATGAANSAMRLTPFVAAVGDGVLLTLSLAGSSAGGQAAGQSAESKDLVRLLHAVGAEMPYAHELGAKLPALTLLVKNRGNHSSPGDVDAVASELANELLAITEGMQKRLASFRYPFPHARGELTVADYAKAEEAGENQWHQAYLMANSHIERLFALHYRLIGRVLALADAGAKTLEIEQ
jgi:hypothetical protein